MILAGYGIDSDINHLDHVDIMNYLIEQDYRIPVKWRTDVGEPLLDLSLELMRHEILKSSENIKDESILRKCFLFTEFSDTSHLSPVKFI